jgi:hypothetical protein
MKRDRLDPARRPVVFTADHPKRVDAVSPENLREASGVSDEVWESIKANGVIIVPSVIDPKVTR